MNEVITNKIEFLKTLIALYGKYDFQFEDKIVSLVDNIMNDMDYLNLGSVQNVINDTKGGVVN